MNDAKEKDSQETVTKSAGKIPLVVTAVATALIAGVSLFVLFFLNPLNWAWEMDVKTSVIETQLESANKTLSNLEETVDSVVKFVLNLEKKAISLENRVANLEAGQEELKAGQEELKAGQEELKAGFESLEASISILLANSSLTKPSSLTIANQ